MIRSYTVSELEQMSGTTRRTISDYIAKGVLVGPSHRGRGARYPQKDLDVLTVLPRLRTLMKKEYPTLKEVSAFLSQLSVRDINKLATLSSEDSFVAEMRRLRVRNSLMGMLPYTAPERIDEVLGQLTRGQIRGIDAGRYHIGAVVDLEALMQEESLSVPATAVPATANTTTDQAAPQESTWTVGWLHEQNQFSQQQVGTAVESALEDTTTDLEGLVAAADQTQPDMQALLKSAANTNAAKELDGGTVEQRLCEIASRLEKLESLLDKA